MPSIKLAISLFMSAVAAHHGHYHHKVHRKSQEVNILKDNFFEEFSMITQKIVNDIFDAMTVSKQFTEEPKIKVLLRMNYDLNNIVEKNLKLYDVLRNASAIETDNKTINQIELNELIMKILNDKKFNMYNKLEDENFDKILNTSETFSSESDDRKEIEAFLGGFNRNLKKLTKDYLFLKKNILNVSEVLQSGRRNLKIWDPSSPENTIKYKVTNRRIFQGKKTNIESYPFIVSIHVEGEFICAGSIISIDLVLTAASCLHVDHNSALSQENMRATYVRYNSDFPSKLGETISVKEIYIYPRYNSKSLNHNLAILRLQKNFKTSRILLDRGNLNVPPNVEIKILGWGTKKPKQNVNQFDKLSYGVLRVEYTDECKEIYSDYYVTKNHICARFGFKLEGIGACTRDVGGPGIIDNLLCGVISFGAPVCGDPNTPTVFTRVGLYIEWIDHIMSLSSISTSTSFGRREQTLTYKTPLTYSVTWPTDNRNNESSTKSSLRSDDLDTQEDTAILHEIIEDVKNKNGMVYDIINHDLYDDFIDIFKPEREQSIIQHPLINKTQYLIRGVQYSRTDPPITLPQTFPTFLLRSTPNEILRRSNPNNTILF